MLPEISYDLIMDDDMTFVEGAFRLPDGEWQVVIFSRADVPDVEVRRQRWHSGVSGLRVCIPRQLRLNKQVVEWILGDEYGVSNWKEVRGPDSMHLR